MIVLLFLIVVLSIIYATFVAVALPSETSPGVAVSPSGLAMSFFGALIILNTGAGMLLATRIEGVDVVLIAIAASLLAAGVYDLVKNK